MSLPRILSTTERLSDIGGLASSSDRITKTSCQLGVENVDILTWSRYLQPGELITA